MAGERHRRDRRVTGVRERRFTLGQTGFALRYRHTGTDVCLQPARTPLVDAKILVHHMGCSGGIRRCLIPVLEFGMRATIKIATVAGLFVGVFTLFSAAAKEPASEPPKKPSTTDSRGIEFAAEASPDSKDPRLVRHGDEVIQIEKRSRLDGRHVRDATAVLGGAGWQIQVRFNDKGGDILSDLSEKLAGTGRRLVIILDGNVLMAPLVREKIPGGTTKIFGRFSGDEAKRIAERIDGSPDARSEREYPEKPPTRPGDDD